MTWQPTRRHFLRATAAAAGAGLLSACGSTPAPKPTVNRTNVKGQAVPQRRPSSGDTVLRVVAPSGFAESVERVELGLSRLYHAGFTVTNQQAGMRRYQRFAGTDRERIDDFQAVAAGRVQTPKVLMGLRGGYGAARLLPSIDFASLGARMRERGTLFFGFSDVCAIQLALLAKGNMMSFAGPMVYSEFGRPELSTYAMDSFIRGTTNASQTIDVPTIQRNDVNVEGVLWGGNLSVLTSLAGTPYLPDVSGGILFLEDVSEQPYRIERMLNTLYLSGVLQKQRAIVFGDFRMGTIRDVYDSSYDLSAVINQIHRVARVPVLTGFPFGHITNKATFPLGAHAKIRSTGNGGYSVTFSGYPTLNAAALNLDSLLPPPMPVFESVPFGGVIDEITE
ncbi:LD-carboxypeptidase [Neisseria animalis]|uniref:Twin-arginine translocation signal domain-containing protein n=1 Tax=Neisseria animalis TaxID=492 RepID=A0A5P3MTV1_NEIAN|nr:LD-carboxypeptidase [Neisseria animalis]QEY25036.1 twin-arginine translocation signal domain-containing protein [Neisseria animalis]ROW31757.1 twin-arginine translocation signal domain-containing protein [Neisseria animalis]